MPKAKDALSMEVDGLLRKLYEVGADWLVVESRGDRWFLHKDRLISFIGMGLGETSIASVLRDKVPSLRADAPDVPIGKSVFLDENGLSMFEPEKVESRPSWWEVPIPLVFMGGDGLDLNPKARDVFGMLEIPKKDVSAAIQNGEHLVSLMGKRIYLSRLEGFFFVAEDVSGDFSLAEDVGWWASVGRALWDRLIDKGFKVSKRERMDQIDGGSEMVTCRWDKEVLGYLEIVEPGRTPRKRTGRKDNDDKKV
ncbi:MAG: hypothetical protein PHU72_01160 [Dethiosulfovibrio sp.]|nr:hypothetical protein [Dethiosulfovibrio sp.]